MNRSIVLGILGLGLAATLTACGGGGGSDECPNVAGGLLGLPQFCDAGGGSGAIGDDPVEGDTPVPLAFEDAAETDEGASVTVSVLGNDEFGVSPTTVTAVTQGNNGTVTIVNATTGEILYAPNTDFSGLDSFTYTITDFNGSTSTINVTILVRELNPVNTTLQNLSVRASFETTSAFLGGMPTDSAVQLRADVSNRVTIGPLAAPSIDQDIPLGTGGGFIDSTIQFSYTGGFAGSDGRLNYFEINLDSQEIAHGSLANILIPEIHPHDPLGVDDDDATPDIDESDPAFWAARSIHFTRIGMLIPGPLGAGLSYASYGIWEVEGQNDFGTSLVGGAMSFGVLTPAGSVPTTGVANYAGVMNGLYLLPSAGAFTTRSYLSGSAALTADFAAGTVSADFTGITATDTFGVGSLPSAVNAAGPTGAFVDIHADATISGNGFSGTAATVAPTGATLSPDLSGEIAGNFFGPATGGSPEEVGGVIRLGDPSGGQVVGGFAATQ